MKNSILKKPADSSRTGISFIPSSAALFAASVILFFVSCAGAFTRPYENPEWKQRGITSLETIRIGGIDQAVLIRGTDLNNPLLVVLHGFAVPMMPFAHLQYAGAGDSYENHFVVVNYDQRGAGKTARLSEADPSSYRLETYINDAEELVGLLMKRFGKRKIYLAGISWGSLIGMKLVQRHPDWFYAYISEGQAVQMAETYADVREFVMAEAKSENNKEALEEINGSRAPVASMTDEEIQENTQVLGKWLEYYYGRKYGLPDLKDFFLKSIREAPEYTFLDFIATVRAIDPFTKRNTRDLFLTDLRREVPEVKVPVYFITGEYDLMKGMGRIYFELLRAPAKQWFEVKRAGHEVSANQPEEVAKIYLEKMVAQTYSR